MKNAWLQKKPAKCGVYDVRSLVFEDGPELLMSIGGTTAHIGGRGGRDVRIEGDRITRLASEFYDVPSEDRFLTENEARNRIVTSSHGGKTPISKMTLLGHGIQGSGRRMMMGSQGEFFKLSTLARDARGHRDGDIIWKWPNFEDVSRPLYGSDTGDWSLPPGCWFSTNAEVRFTGCKTGRFARQFARLYLRKGAKAWGTKRDIQVVSSDTEGIIMGYRPDGATWAERATTVEAFHQRTRKIWPEEHPNGAN